MARHKQSQKVRGSLKSAIPHHKWGFLLFVSITKVANFLQKLPCKAKKYDHSWIGDKSGEVNAQTQSPRWATLNLLRVSSLPLISRLVFWALLKWVYTHVPGLKRPPDHTNTFSKVCVLIVNEKALTASCRHYPFDMFSTVHTKTFENSRTASCDVGWTLYACYQHMHLR